LSRNNAVSSKCASRRSVNLRPSRTQSSSRIFPVNETGLTHIGAEPVGVRSPNQPPARCPTSYGALFDLSAAIPLLATLSITRKKPSTNGDGERNIAGTGRFAIERECGQGPRPLDRPRATRNQDQERRLVAGAAKAQRRPKRNGTGAAGNRKRRPARVAPRVPSENQRADGQEAADHDEGLEPAAASMTRRSHSRAVIGPENDNRRNGRARKRIRRQRARHTSVALCLAIR